MSSSDHGSTWAPPIRVNDRGIDRSKGVWSNNIDSKFNVGIASTNDAVFFAWQDTRNAIGSTDAEDVYAATFSLTGGNLTLTVGASAALTDEASGVAANTITGTLGTVSVTDARGGTAGWVASAGSSTFTGAGLSTSTGVASETCRRSPSPSTTPCPRRSAWPTGCSATRS